MITKSIDIMKSNPGIWTVITNTGIVFIDVEVNGTVHQLNPSNFERDGELRPDGWNFSSIQTAVGPLARVN